jgi:hypothetical protein
MIVSVTRDDLRDEFDMADEAFALSPISARATQPSAEDYEAISQAFMETSRGRWFLGEYAKRNRNADTRMVLDAVAKIEESLAAQRQQAASDNGLAEALAAIRRSVDEAKTAAAAAVVESLALEENLAPIRKGARIIKEISWRWREIGADARICDLIDSQVGAIEGACGQVSSTSAQAALEAAFDLIKARIAEFGDGDVAAAQTAEAAAAPAHQTVQEAAPSPSTPAPEEAFSSPAPAAVAEMPVEAAAASPETPAAEHAEAAVGAPAMPAEAVVATEAYAAMVETAEVVAEAADTTAEATDIAVEAFDVPSEADAETADAADAYDEALLDMVALEMGAPDPADFDEAPVVADDEAQISEQPPAEPVIVAEQPEPVSVAEPPPVQPALEATPEPAVEPSLGSTLLASGIVRKPKFAASDPLAPIRRMSQAEKIAFFS